IPVENTSRSAMLWTVGVKEEVIDNAYIGIQCFPCGIWIDSERFDDFNLRCFYLFAKCGGLPSVKLYGLQSLCNALLNNCFLRIHEYTSCFYRIGKRDSREARRVASRLFIKDEPHVIDG